MAKSKGGRPASYSREQVREALAELFKGRGRVPTDLPHVPYSDVLPTMTARFGTSETVRPEALQEAIDDVFDEMVQHQREQDRANLTEEQLDQISLLTACLEAALVDTLHKDNERLARAQFETLKRCDAEKDLLKEDLAEAKENLRNAKARIADLFAGLDRVQAELASQKAENDRLRLEIAHLQGQLHAYDRHAAAVGS